jgi:acyl-CoA reductase-like NAD-dependent aldehyde dehydrogenase
MELVLCSCVGRFFFSWNQGQSCCGSSRIFVQSGIYDAFLGRLTEKARDLRLGDPFVEGYYMGPQVSKDHFDVGRYGSWRFETQ